MVITKQNRARQMQDVVAELLKFSQLVVDLFSGTFVTTKACLELPYHRSFAGCKFDAYSFAASRKSLVETHTRQVLSKKSDVSGADEVLDA